MSEVTERLKKQLEALQKLIQELEECPDCGESPKLLPELYKKRSQLVLELESEKEKTIGDE